MSRTRVNAAAIAAFFAASACAQSNWDMAAPKYSTANFHVLSTRQFVADVEEGTRGKLKIRVSEGAFPAFSDAVRAVQDNRMQIGEAFLSGNFAEPLYVVDSVPFLATSYADAARLWSASRSAIENRFANLGLMVLYSVPWGPQGVFSTRAINSIADLKGLKLRTFSPYTQRMAELAGAQPVSVPPAELAQKIATGVLDAFFASGESGYELKDWEFMKYYCDMHAWFPKNIVFVNKRSFDALDSASQAAVLKAARDAEARGWKNREEKDSAYLDRLAKSGVSVYRPSSELLGSLMRIGETMTVQWLAAAGAGGTVVVEAYRNNRWSETHAPQAAPPIAQTGRDEASIRPIDDVRERGRAQQRLAQVDQMQQTCMGRCLTAYDRCFEKAESRGLAELNLRIARGGRSTGFDFRADVEACTSQRDSCDTECNRSADAARNEVLQSSAPRSVAGGIAAQSAATAGYGRDVGAGANAGGRCGACETATAPQLGECNSGSISACYRAAAASCQCYLDAGGCGISPSELQTCIASNAAHADSLRSDAPTWGVTRSPSTPPTSPPPVSQPPAQRCGQRVCAGRGS